MVVHKVAVNESSKGPHTVERHNNGEKDEGDTGVDEEERRSMVISMIYLLEISGKRYEHYPTSPSDK